MKKYLFALLAVPFTLGLQGCRDEQVALTAGLVGGAIIGASVSDRDNYRPRRCVSGYQRSCHTWYNQWGRPMRECRRVYNRCAYTRYNVNAIEQANDKAADMVPGIVADFAGNYKIGFTAANEITHAFARGAEGDLSGLAQVGLGENDLRQVYNGRMPDDAAVSRVSQTLDMSLKDVRKLLNKGIKETQRKKIELGLPERI